MRARRSSFLNARRDRPSAVVASRAPPTDAVPVPLHPLADLHLDILNDDDDDDDDTTTAHALYRRRPPPTPRQSTRLSAPPPTRRSLLARPDVAPPRPSSRPRRGCPPCSAFLPPSARRSSRTPSARATRGDELAAVSAMVTATETRRCAGPHAPFLTPTSNRTSPSPSSPRCSPYRRRRLGLEPGATVFGPSDRSGARPPRRRPRGRTRTRRWRTSGTWSAGWESAEKSAGGRKRRRDARARAVEVPLVASSSRTRRANRLAPDPSAPRSRPKSKPKVTWTPREARGRWARRRRHRNGADGVSGDGAEGTIPGGTPATATWTRTRTRASTRRIPPWIPRRRTRTRRTRTRRTRRIGWSAARRRSRGLCHQEDEGGGGGGGGRRVGARDASRAGGAPSDRRGGGDGATRGRRRARGGRGGGFGGAEDGRGGRRRRFVRPRTPQPHEATAARTTGGYIRRGEDAARSAPQAAAARARARPRGRRRRPRASSAGDFEGSRRRRPRRVPRPRARPPTSSAPTWCIVQSTRTRDGSNLPARSRVGGSAPAEVLAVAERAAEEASRASPRPNTRRASSDGAGWIGGGKPRSRGPAGRLAAAPTAVAPSGTRGRRRARNLLSLGPPRLDEAEAEADAGACGGARGRSPRRSRQRRARARASPRDSRSRPPRPHAPSTRACGRVHDVQRHGHVQAAAGGRVRACPTGAPDA